MRGYDNHDADNALMEAARLMQMIICTKDDVGANKAAVQKAQRRYDALIKLLAELLLVDENVLSYDLSIRILKKTSEATRFYYHSNV